MVIFQVNMDFPVATFTFLLCPRDAHPLWRETKVFISPMTSNHYEFLRRSYDHMSTNISKK